MTINSQGVKTLVLLPFLLGQPLWAADAAPLADADTESLQ
jgi:hypothetical protein